MLRRLWLETGVAHEMLAACQAAYPAEACGLLGGKGTLATSHFPVPNVADRPGERFEMDPAGQAEALAAIAARGEDLVAIYHSHPATAAVPSRADLRRAAYPGVFHLIVGLAGARPRIRAYLIDPAVRRAVEVRWYTAPPRRVRFRASGGDFPPV